MLVNTFYEAKVEQLFEVVARLHTALAGAGIEYRIIGGMAVYMHVNAVDPIAARLTRDVDAAVARRDLAAIVAAVAPYGLKYRHVAGIDMLVDAREPKARSAVHLVFVQERVRPTDPQPVPGFSTPACYQSGITVVPVPELLQMKLTSFRLKDQVHIQDMDKVGLITPEIEALLSEVLAERLRQVRAAL
ncbi:MAG: hypothetical protein HYR60_28620 [Acidobacteria bacterium]|nr:hypothetical protein [Acidobacteriota bacterium]